jgi:hypothetical protein
MAAHNNTTHLQTKFECGACVFTLEELVFEAFFLSWAHVWNLGCKAYIVDVFGVVDRCRTIDKKEYTCKQERKTL